MNASSEQSRSSWMETAETVEPPPLGANTQADVCVIGAGIAGLTTAYLLARDGRSVVVLDSGPVGGGQTARTTAHLSTELDDGYYEMAQIHGQHTMRLVAQSYTEAINRVEAIVKEEGIDCDFERLDGYLFSPRGEDPSELDDELEAAYAAGLVEVEKVARVPWGDYDTGPALRFPNQAQFHPLKYLNGLAAAITRLGGRIYSNTHVIKLRGGTPARVLTRDGAVVTARALVVATNTPISDRLAIHLKQGAYRTYVIGLRVPKGSISKALYWDTLDPYHYVRIQEMPGQSEKAEQPGEINEQGEPKDETNEPYDLLIVGGEDHKTGQSDDGDRRYDSLEEWTRFRFPNAGKMEFWWSGQVMEPVDGLAYIGIDLSAGANVYIATGDSGQGTTHGTIAGIIINDLIHKRRNPWAAVYDPARITVGAATEFAKEAGNIVLQYTDWLDAGDVDSTQEIEPGEGAVIRRGLRKVAVYRDDDGRLHSRSAVCPHLGCIVAWNSSESTWDCPCHGSHFDPYGRVLNGPSATDLRPVKD